MITNDDARWAEKKRKQKAAQRPGYGAQFQNLYPIELRFVLSMP